MSCQFNGCGRKVYAKGKCFTHYEFARLHPGEELKPLRMTRGTRLPGPVCVSKTCAARLAELAEARKITVYALEQEILEKYVEGLDKIGSQR